MSASVIYLLDHNLNQITLWKLNTKIHSVTLVAAGGIFTFYQLNISKFSLIKILSLYWWQLSGLLVAISLKTLFTIKISSSIPTPRVDGVTLVADLWDYISLLFIEHT